MTMVDVPTLLTTIFVLVHDWYQSYGQRLLPVTPGPQPTFSHSEMLTLLLAMDYLPIQGNNSFSDSCGRIT